ncbi:hypothetical protein ACFYST_15230 [Kitasatospora sp. NPDC004614]|uniref:hypothetical protein n=1 Tax=unclassified Kitasatospora TaxID=2633591 RepID=UPI0036A1638C
MPEWQGGGADPGTGELPTATAENEPAQAEELLAADPATDTAEQTDNGTSTPTS